ncbi:glycosyltransferase family 2 protein [Roseovarius sp. D22-M7]|uniref:glycosyltransferase family 2 protein n=1 Tax=Roseovarius sp. D22-M7 TaxID=3127116 RepID=UPI00301041B7
MTSPSTVSVIIPTYNRAHCVGEAIDSVLAQDPPADEVIVIDDGSTDSTPDVLAGYGDRITVIRQKNAGSGAARTAGLRHAQCDWITFLDSDDLWYPGRLALLHHDLANEDNDDIVMHFADHQMTGAGYEEDLFELRNIQIPEGGTMRVNDALRHALAGLHLNSMAVRADVAKTTKGFPSELTIEQDVYFVCSVALLGPALFSRTIVAEVRRLPGEKVANLHLHQKDPLKARQITQLRLDMVADLSMSPERKKFVRRHASGHLFKLAHAEFEAGKGTPRRHLLRMALNHPNPIIGWLKALPPLLLGRIGFSVIPQNKTNFTRDPETTGEASHSN